MLPYYSRFVAIDVTSNTKLHFANPTACFAGTKVRLPIFGCVIRRAVGGMELVVRYRQYAAECLRIAQQMTDAATKSSLIDMAQVWASLAEQTEKRHEPVFSSGSPPADLSG